MCLFTHLLFICLLVVSSETVSSETDWSEIHYVGLASISPCFSLFLRSTRHAEVCHHSQLQVVFNDQNAGQLI